MAVIQYVADMFITASIGDDTSNSESYNSNKNETYNNRKLLIKLPEDIILQKNLIINEMAMKSAEKGDYVRSIALLNTAMNRTNFTQEVLLKSTILSSLNDTNFTSTCDRIEQVSIVYFNISEYFLFINLS